MDYHKYEQISASKNVGICLQNFSIRACFTLVSPNCFKQILKYSMEAEKSDASEGEAHQHEGQAQNEGQQHSKISEIKSQHPVELDYRLTLTDNILVMLVKQQEYVQSLTGYKYGFNFEGHNSSSLDVISKDIISPEHWALWTQIEHGRSKRCSNLKNFLVKMLASKSPQIISDIFYLYMEALIKILYIDDKFNTWEYNEKVLIQLSRLFSRRFCLRCISQNQYNEFVSIEPKYLNLALLSRSIEIKEIATFQSNFLANYSRWKQQFQHLVEVIYFCLSLEFYDVPVNYLYEGYFMNTELVTERNRPKIKLGV